MPQARRQIDHADYRVPMSRVWSTKTIRNPRNLTYKEVKRRPTLTPSDTTHAGNPISTIVDIHSPAVESRARRPTSQIEMRIM